MESIASILKLDSHVLAAENRHKLLVVGLAVFFAYLVYVLNGVLGRIDTPVVNLENKKRPSRRDSKRSSNIATPKEFPWRTAETNDNKSWLEMSRDVINWFPLVRWIVSIFDFEGRRTRKWDEERRRWRDLQQQLSNLRSLRAQREAANKSANEEDDQTEPFNQRRSSQQKSTAQIPTFPWKPSTGSTVGVMAYLQQYLGQSSFIRALHWMFSQEERRKQKCDKEKRKWRNLQQQLATLRIVKAQRQACAAANTKFTYTANELKVETTPMMFPWKDDSGSIRVLMESIGQSSWVNSLQWVFSGEERRKQKWEPERRRWRDLQQQLSVLRCLRAQRQKCSAPNNELEVENKPKVFPWKEEEDWTINWLPGWVLPLLQMF